MARRRPVLPRDVRQRRPENTDRGPGVPDGLRANQRPHATFPRGDWQVGSDPPETVPGELPDDQKRRRAREHAVPQAGQDGRVGGGGGDDEATAGSVHHRKKQKAKGESPHAHTHTHHPARFHAAFTSTTHAAAGIPKTRKMNHTIESIPELRLW